MSTENPIIAQYFGISDDWYDRAMKENPPFEKLNRLFIYCIRGNKRWID